ncbi:hypothetical protein ACFXG4_27070 [Nocardia sp. NPDC059246]|uniref:phage tail fiber protein n=1 Tax=unclassified Nocardia TaxID=2637762 RepID=UPI0036869140
MVIAVPTTRQSLATYYGTLGTWISLHTADPGTTGASEASGGTPAYARKQTTWTPSTGGLITGTQVTFDVPLGTYGWIGIWNASSGSTGFVDKLAITSVQLNGQGQILVTPSYTQS